MRNDMAERAGGSALREFFIGKGAASGCPFHRFNHRVVEDVKAVWGLGRQAFARREPLSEAGPSARQMESLAAADLLKDAIRPADNPAQAQASDFSGASIYRLAMNAKKDDLERQVAEPGRESLQAILADNGPMVPKSLALTERMHEILSSGSPALAIIPEASVPVVKKTDGPEICIKSASNPFPLQRPAEFISPAESVPLRLERIHRTSIMLNSLGSSPSLPALPPSSAALHAFAENREDGRPKTQPRAENPRKKREDRKAAPPLASDVTVKNRRAGAIHMDKKKGAEVDAYIAAAPAAVRAKLKELRLIIRKAAPKAKESISYGMPGYDKGKVCWFGISKRHIGLYLRPPVIGKHKKDLAGYETTKSAVHLPPDKKIPAGLVRKLVTARIKMNQEMAKASVKIRTPAICSRGHRFRKSREIPVCPACWPGRYKQRKAG